MIYQKIKEKVLKWEKDNYVCNYPEIAEIFSYLKHQAYLRRPQIEALEHYWYVRVILGTPKIEDHYRNFYNGPSFWL